LNLRQAAERARLPGAQFWSDVEGGRRFNLTLQTIVKIATALECDARDLITAPDAKAKRTRKGK